MGDQVLQVLAERLRRPVRPTDGAARVRGDEFAVVMADINDPAVARAVAAKVLASVQTPFAIGELQLTISASIGIAFCASLEAGWPYLVARADANLYKGNAAGRGRYVYGDDAAVGPDA